MDLTKYPDVNIVVELLLKKLKEIFESKLIGLYLEGSLVIGDFDPEISDIDLVAAISEQITDEEFEKLEKMHANLVREKPEWDDRIEVCYITADLLGKVKSSTGEIVNISPGEPIHRKESSKEWVTNWYLTREKSLTIYGPDPKTIIEPISKEEFVESVKSHTKSWPIWLNDFPKNVFAQSYARLALCRALYSIRYGDQASKKKSALWAIEEYPEWKEVINEALTWRNGPKHSADDDLAFTRTKKFVEFASKSAITHSPIPPSAST